MVHIAVLMTCHNRKVKTLYCLNSLFHQQGINDRFTIQVYLVDDGSSDGTSVEVSKLFPKVQVIQGNGELFWNRGMYTAWEAASQDNEQIDHYLWLNDDTDLYSFALDELLDSADQTKNGAIICGSIESPVNKGELTYGGGKLKGAVRTMNYPNLAIEECHIIHGNCVLVPKSVYNLVGNFDWKFSHAIGDHDYSLRARKAGIKSYTTGKFIGCCAKNDSLPKWCLPQTKIGARLKNLYSPLSYSPPDEFFQFERRHFGYGVALKHFFSIHLRVLMPGLWKTVKS